MNYPDTFSQDLKELAARYEWTAEEKSEIRTAFTDSEPMVHFLVTLAAAHRAGYEQCAANGFVRLENWCIEKEIGNPFGAGDFNPVALDGEQFQQRIAA